MSGVIGGQQDKATTTSAVAKSPTRWEGWKQTLLDFWKKCSNDSIFNFSGLLAYALLMAIFPLFLVPRRRREWTSWDAQETSWLVCCAGSVSKWNLHPLGRP
jgi:hypothetical protein